MMVPWEIASEHLPPPVNQIVCECIRTAQDFGGDVLDLTSRVWTISVIVDGDVREERIADRSVDMS